MSFFFTEASRDRCAQFLEGPAVISAHELAERAAGLAERYRESGFAWMVRSARASDVFGALLLSEELNVPLVICHTHLAGDQVREIQDTLRVGAVIHPKMEVEILSAGPLERESAFSILLMTSGTTGKPKIARHSPANLLGRMRATRGETRPRWLMTYPPTTFAGMQVLLTAATSGSDLISPESYDIESLARAAEELGATHISGTPTFWRALMVALGQGASLPALQQATLGGEISDQATLNRIRERFPGVRISHIYASTEAGSLFSVHDGKAGFPAVWLTDGIDGTGLQIRDEVLWVRSPRRMLEYASEHKAAVTEGGWLCTGDRVRVSGERVHFEGRTDQIVNIGGYKVSPADVEAAILQVEGVVDVAVRAVRNPITGFVLAAEIVPVAGIDEAALRSAVTQHCRQTLPVFQVPRMIKFVARSAAGYSGKKQMGETE